MRRSLLGWLVLAALGTLMPSSALAGPANGGLPGATRANPLAHMKWGIYTGSLDGVWPAYSASSGRNRRLLAKIALRSSMHWFGVWDTDPTAGQVARQYIAQDTGGSPAVLSQIAVFRLDPWEGCHPSPSAARQASYRRWIDNFATGIGAARAAMILQPDLTFAECSPGRAQWLAMVAYAARRFSALPHTTVYIDAGARYWPSPRVAAGMLAAAGVRYTRGFALNDTEYDSTSAELGQGAAIESALAGRGIRGKHFVVNTSTNGVPFLNGQYHGNVANPRVCRSPHDHLCATLGIPPTTHTADRRWGLPARARSIAAHYADAYLWVGRPWLDNGSAPFDLRRALGLASSTPY